METKTKILLLILNCFYLMGVVTSFSVTVPPIRSVCKTMTPGHDKITGQEGEPPFNVTTDITTVKGGQLVDVILSAFQGKSFKGYYVQARDSNNSPIGTFNANALTKTHSCGGIKGNAGHHADAEEKEKLKVSWTAPSNYQGEVQFLATFVEQFTTFWPMVKASQLVTVIA